MEFSELCLLGAKFKKIDAYTDLQIAENQMSKTEQKLAALNYEKDKLLADLKEDENKRNNCKLVAVPYLVDDNNFNHATSPLWIPELYDCIINYVGFKDKKNLRLVCKKFNDYSKEPLRAKEFIFSFTEPESNDNTKNGYWIKNMLWMTYVPHNKMFPIVSLSFVVTYDWNVIHEMVPHFQLTLKNLSIDSNKPNDFFDLESLSVVEYDFLKLDLSPEFVEYAHHRDSIPSRVISVKRLWVGCVRGFQDAALDVFFDLFKGQVKVEEPIINAEYYDESLGLNDPATDRIIQYATRKEKSCVLTGEIKNDSSNCGYTGYRVYAVDFN